MPYIVLDDWTRNQSKATKECCTCTFGIMHVTISIADPSCSVFLCANRLYFHHHLLNRLINVTGSTLLGVAICKSICKHLFKKKNKSETFIETTQLSMYKIKSCS